MEKLPLPFGLIRYGVAPDNQSLKRIIKDLSKLGDDERFSFYGNINIVKDFLRNIDPKLGERLDDKTITKILFCSYFCLWIWRFLL